MPHRDVEQGKKKHNGPEKAVLHLLKLRLILGLRRFVCRSGSRTLQSRLGAVSGSGNRGGNGVAVQGGVVVLYLHAVGHQAYGYILHAGQFFHGFFHMGHASAAGHAGHVKFLLHNSSPDFLENQINIAYIPHPWGVYICGYYKQTLA